MTELCRHIKPEGTACKGPAVRGTHLCRHHQLIRNTLDKVKPTRKNFGIYTPLPFVFPEDRSAIQTNLFLVLHAFNDRKIDARAASFMTYNLQVCLSNLSKGGPLAPSDTIRRVILTPEGDEIAPPREVLEKDESPLHYKDCPCRSCAEKYRGAEPERHHAECRCGVCVPKVQPKVQQGASGEESGATDGVKSDAAVREAPAQALRSAGALDPIQKQPNYHDYLYGDEIAKHEAQHAARVRAAIEAGLEPPEHTLWDISTYEHPWDREHREWKEGIDQRRKEAIDDWNAKNPDQPKEFKPYLTWGEEHDLKLAEMKRLQEQDEARVRGEALPAS